MIYVIELFQCFILIHEPAVIQFINIIFTQFYKIVLITNLMHNTLYSRYKKIFFIGKDVLSLLMDFNWCKTE